MIQNHMGLFRRANPEQDENSPLSFAEARRVEKLGGATKKYLDTLSAGNPGMKRLVIALATARATLETAERIAQMIGAPILVIHPYTRPQPLGEEEKILERIVTDTAQLGVWASVVIAHGSEMPARILRLAYEKTTGRKLESSLPYMHASGYFISRLPVRLTYVSPEYMNGHEVPGTQVYQLPRSLPPTGVHDGEDEDPS